MSSSRSLFNSFASDDSGCPPVSQRGVRGQLVVTAGPCPGRVIPFVRQGLPVSMGRAPECEVRFDARTVSPIHANAVWIGDKHFITDAGSTLGTFVNNCLADVATPLAPGDRVSLGPEVAMAFEVVRAPRGPAQDCGVPSVRDPVTGMYHGSYLEQVLDEALRRARSCGIPLTLMLIRIDQLKEIERTFGPAARDELVSAVLCMIASWTRDTDTIGHHGTDDLMVIAPATSLPRARSVAERLRGEVAATPLTWQSEPLHITLSIGLASIACCGTSAGVRRLLAIASSRTGIASQYRNCVVAQGE